MFVDSFTKQWFVPPSEHVSLGFKLDATLPERELASAELQQSKSAFFKFLRFCSTHSEFNGSSAISEGILPTN